MERIKMKDLPPERRPYEKCRQLGAAALSDAELLAVIIRTGSRLENSLKLAERILGQGGPQDGREGLASLLHRSLEDWMKLDGIGLVKGLQLCCIGELSRRIWRRRERTPSSWRWGPATWWTPAASSPACGGWAIPWSWWSESPD